MKKSEIFIWILLILTIIGGAYLFYNIIHDLREPIPNEYYIDNTNITCNYGVRWSCGFDLTDCNDGFNRKCVGNVIINKTKSL
jgi:hypothetical protein